MKRKDFTWHGFDLRPHLPDGWQEEILDYAQKNAVPKDIVPTSVTSRESADVKSLPVLTVGGQRISNELVWLDKLYRTTMLRLGQRCVDEELSVAKDPRYGINLNVQKGSSMRYESHVDSNPLEGLLYITSHPEGSGGELVVANNLDATSVEEVDRDCTIIYPVAGHLVFFDARKHAHYVRPLLQPTDIRVVVAMNFYTPSCSESGRPSDLNDHLGIA